MDPWRDARQVSRAGWWEGSLRRFGRHIEGCPPAFGCRLLHVPFHGSRARARRVSALIALNQRCSASGMNIKVLSIQFLKLTNVANACIVGLLRCTHARAKVPFSHLPLCAPDPPAPFELIGFVAEVQPLRPSPARRRRRPYSQHLLIDIRRQAQSCPYATV